MAIENRHGRCRTCGGAAYRQPTKSADIRDGWFHREPRDWINNPHDVDPIPNEQENDE